MKNPEFAKKRSDEQFRGLCIDLLKELKKRIGFSYTIHLSPDGKYGVQDAKTQQWNGMVRDIIDGVISFSLGCLRMLPAPFKFCQLKC